MNKIHLKIVKSFATICYLW